MLSINEIKRMLVRHNREFDVVLSLAVYVIAYCLQVGSVAALGAVSLYIVIAWGSDVYELLLYSSLIFVFTSGMVSVLCLWFLRVTMSMSETRMRRRDMGGRYASKKKSQPERVIPVGGVGRERMYLVDGEMLSREELMLRYK